MIPHRPQEARHRGILVGDVSRAVLLKEHASVHDRHVLTFKVRSLGLDEPGLRAGERRPRFNRAEDRTESAPPLRQSRRFILPTPHTGSCMLRVCEFLHKSCRHLRVPRGAMAVFDLVIELTLAS